VLESKIGGTGEFGFYERRVLTTVRIDELVPPVRGRWTVVLERARRVARHAHPVPWVIAPSLKLHAIKSPAVISPIVAVATSCSFEPYAALEASFA
jgi:hypothetical protein